MTPKDLYQAAELLHTISVSFKQHPDKVPAAVTEGVERAVVSRGYYALYLYAEAVAIHKGFEHEPGGSKHEAVWNWFKQNGHRQIAQRGKALKAKRHNADYDIRLTWQYDPADILQEAAELQSLIDESIVLE
jgi:uncharacterized protein (UPF0332 family)